MSPLQLIQKLRRGRTARRTFPSTQTTQTTPSSRPLVTFTEISTSRPDDDRPAMHEIWAAESEPSADAAHNIAPRLVAGDYLVWQGAVLDAPVRFIYDTRRVLLIPIRLYYKAAYVATFDETDRADGIDGQDPLGPFVVRMLVVHQRHRDGVRPDLWVVSRPQSVPTLEDAGHGSAPNVAALRLLLDGQVLNELSVSSPYAHYVMAIS